jgi:hypothetical protein
MPAYQLEPLIRYLPALEAQRAARCDHGHDCAAYQAVRLFTLMRSLRRLADELDPPPPPEPPRVYQEVDREKARAWFEQQGVKIVPKEVDTAWPSFRLGEAALGTAVDLSGLNKGIDQAEAAAKGGFARWAMC